MRPKVYVETSVISYLTAWPSRDLIIAAHQQLTRDWWQTRRAEYELFISQIVLLEAGAGDQEAAAQRLAAVQDLPVLEQTEAMTALARELVGEVPLPAKAAVDALHIGISVVSGMDYLLTWNCTHIANAALRNRIEDVCHARGYEAPVICTPEELMGGETDVAG